jgi:hypothetical protein
MRSNGFTQVIQDYYGSEINEIEIGWACSSDG